MAVYTIEPTEETVHIFFSAEIAPVLTIRPGDTVRFRTLDAGGGLEARRGLGVPRRRIVPRLGGPNGHALCGPVAIAGAEPGMTLVIEIESLRPGRWGWTEAEGELTGGEEVLHLWELDPETMTGRNQHGHVVALRPFMGVMGLPPAEAGQHSTIPPRFCGGNLDCKELVAGSRLYLPVTVAGGLFSVGDGHGRQGDGEISGTAIECPMDEVVLRFELRPEMRLTAPRAWTPAGWLTFGLDSDLNVACRLAVEGMVGLMVEELGLARADAVALASLVVDLRITQIVNGVCGVHAVLPHGAVMG
jgi:acetamidase/formamidase